MPGDDVVLALGCTLRVQTPSPIGAVMQVAPAPAPDLTVRREGWATTARHHTYVDRYGNRCERLRIDAGETELTYDAVVACSPEPDTIAVDAVEVPAIELPDDLLHFVMPSRFCLPDELGHEAWQRFGDLAPGWAAGPGHRRLRARPPRVHARVRRTRGRRPPTCTAPDKVCAATSPTSRSRSVGR